MTISGRTALYRLRDAEGRLLYVGIAANPDLRWGQHSLTKPWWSAVEVRELEWHPSRSEAEAAERRAIQREVPVWNEAHDLADAASLADIPASVRKAMGALGRAKIAVVEARELLRTEIIASLTDGMLGPTRVAKLAELEPQTIRKYARDAGVPPAEPGIKSAAKWSKETGLPLPVVIERQQEAESRLTGAVRLLKRRQKREDRLKTAVRQEIKLARAAGIEPDERYRERAERLKAKPTEDPAPAESA